jgi:hypothetical protein
MWERLLPLAKSLPIDVAPYVYGSHWKGLAESALHEIAHGMLIWGQPRSSDAIGVWVRDMMDDLDADFNEAQALAVEAVVFRRLRLPHSVRALASYAWHKSNLRSEPTARAWEVMVLASMTDKKVQDVAGRIVTYLLTDDAPPATI